MLSSQYLKNNGYPKLGRLICKKGDVNVYEYGAHNVIRIYKSNGGTALDRDFELSNYLKENHVDHVTPVKDSRIITKSGVRYLIIKMRKYLPYSEGRTDWPRVNYSKTIETARYSHSPFWDVDSGNFGVDTRTRKLVVYDIWHGVGGGRNPLKFGSSPRPLITNKTLRNINKMKKELETLYGGPIGCQSCFCSAKAFLVRSCKWDNKFYKLYNCYPKYWKCKVTHTY